ncbi:MAG: alpha/beta hydrolase [Fibrobacter sp.]|nr:alpha/beta hydrolase [Fibrobacter sp.]
MKSLFNHKLPIALFTVTALATAANAACERYKDCSFDVKKTADVVYAENVPHLNQLHDLSTIAVSMGADIYFYKNENDFEYKALTMDIYSPKEDNEKKRAAVIVAHGGAFIGGAKDDTDQKSVAYCNSLAALGFVTASIEYRLGVTMSGNFDMFSLAMGKTITLSIDSVDFARAVYRGVQDINAAVRYLRANAETYDIDPERIYVLGNSAGAILAIENIYTNSETDFPDYSYQEEKDKENVIVRPALGGLNEYGVEKTLDAHANGAVALWGATHNPAVLKYNKTPIFLAHGKKDGTVKFDTGYPLSDASGMLKRNLPAAYSEYADQINLKVETPTLYGSYVIDSALTVNNGSKKKPVTLFVDDAGHEFYDESADKEKAVKDGVFGFLYNLAKSDKIVRELAGVTIAKANANEDSVYAVIDGSYDGKDTLNIADEIKVNSLSFNREFTPLTYSTLTLPFSVETDKVNGLEAALRYNGIGKDKEGNDAVKMKVVWATENWVKEHQIKDAKDDFMTYGNVELAANTPYLVQMGESGTFRLMEEAFPLKLQKTADAETSANGYAFRGTWAYKKWVDGDPELGKAYGFAASSSDEDKIKVGDFVKVGEGAWITPMRAYLVSENPQGVRANGAYVKPGQKLPEIMSIIIDNEDGNEEHTTVIGQFNTRTGEFRMNYDRGKFDLKGRRVNGTNNARGAYYGKNVLKK